MKFTSPAKVNPGYEGDLQDPMEYPNEKKDLAMAEDVSVKKIDRRQKSLRVVIAVAVVVAIAASIGLVVLLTLENSSLFKKNDLRPDDFRIAVKKNYLYDGTIGLSCEVEGRKEDVEDFSFTIYRSDNTEVQLLSPGSALVLLRNKENDGRYYCAIRYKNKWELVSAPLEIKYDLDFRVTLYVEYKKAGAELKCSVDGDKDAKMLYYFNYPLSLQIQHLSDTIFVDKGSYNEGTFTCEVSLNGVRERSNPVAVKFNQIRPTVTGMPSKAPLNTDVELRCDLGGQQQTPISYVWFIGRNLFARNTQTLPFSMDSSDYNQDVTCTAYFEDMILKSDPVRTPAQPEEADVSIFASYYPETFGVVLACQINGKSVRRDQDILYSFYHPKHPKKHSATIYDALVLLPAKEAEDTYSCKVTYKNTEWQRQSNTVDVRFDKTPPEVKGMPQTASVNSKVTLRCESKYQTNQQIRSYSWHIGNRTLESTKSTAEFTMGLDDFDKNVRCKTVYEHMEILSRLVTTPAEPTNQVELHISYYPTRVAALLECRVNGKHVNKPGYYYRINKAVGTSTIYTPSKNLWILFNNTSNRGPISCTMMKENVWKQTSQKVDLTFDFQTPVVKKMVTSAKENQKVELFCDNSDSKVHTSTFSWTLADKTLPSTSQTMELSLDRVAFGKSVVCSAQYPGYEVRSEGVKTPARPLN